MSGDNFDLTPKQSAALDKFRSSVQDILKAEDNNDHYLLRWLKARYFDAGKAEKMLREHYKWYAENDIEHILDWTPPEVLPKYFPGGYFGESKGGYPVYYELSMLSDIKALPYVSSHQEIVKFKIQSAVYNEKVRFPLASKKYGRRIDKIVIILDLTGLSTKFFSKSVVDIWGDVLRQLEAHFPERTKKIFIINAPSLFPIGYNMVKAFLSPETKEKIEVCGGDWKKDLLREIAPDQLPVHWGGTATGPDGDPCCQLCMGGKIPDSYYRLRSLKESADLSEYTKAVIVAGDSLKLQYQVVVEGTILRWNFWSEGNDIGFGVSRRVKDSDEVTEVLPSNRVNSHLLPEYGSITCDIIGTYVVHFDNTYSWLKSKELYYQINLLEPGDLNRPL